MSWINTSFECPSCKATVALEKIRKPTPLVATYISKKCKCGAKVDLNIKQGPVRPSGKRDARIQIIEVHK